MFPKLSYLDSFSIIGVASRISEVNGLKYDEVVKICNTCSELMNFEGIRKRRYWIKMNSVMAYVYFICIVVFLPVQLLSDRDLNIYEGIIMIIYVIL